MTSRRLLTVLLFLPILAAAPALAQTNCPTNGRKAPRVTVVQDPAASAYRNDLSQTELTELFTKQRRVNYGASRKAVTAGLTRAEGGYEVRAQAMIYPLKKNVQYCGWLSQIEVRLFFKSMTVNVAEEYKPGSCEFTAVMDHENKHVAIFRRNMDIYSRQIKIELEKAVARYGAAFASSEQGVTRQFMTEAGRIIKPLLDEMHEQSERDHGKLDSPQSYQYTQNLCKGWKF
ncbi:exported hypothetical protein [Rhodospirillaceae bacterium LM-1]|nr:exported hypothetical protein [Rhodospirillaceae bacterium LM-1]